MSPEFQAHLDTFRATLAELTQRFEGEVPKFSPRYVGHMFSEISLPALAGHVLTLLHNPNNISGESSRVGLEIEREAIADLATMVGYDPKQATGHFTSGGTVANFEALVRARAHLRETQGLTPEAALRAIVLAPESKHYSWVKGTGLMGLPFESLWRVRIDSSGRMDIAGLRDQLLRARAEKRPILMVVGVLGTTELGTIDPIDRISPLLEQLFADAPTERPWFHVDAAYGGFLRTVPRGVFPIEAGRALEAMSQADSITLDPHKLGYVPYASGVFLVRDRTRYPYRAFDHAPYIDFDASHDPGLYTLEGSRSATGAVATWMSARTMGLHEAGYGLLLERTIRIARELGAKIEREHDRVRLAPGCDSNVIAFHLAERGQRSSESNAETLRCYERFSVKAGGPFIVSKTALSRRAYGALLDGWIPSWEGVIDSEEIVLIRMCLMNPFFSAKESRVDFADAFSRALGAR